MICLSLVLSLVENIIYINICLYWYVVINVSIVNYHTIIFTVLGGG